MTLQLGACLLVSTMARHTRREGATHAARGRDTRGARAAGLGAGAGSPPGADLGEDFIAEGIDAAAAGQGVGYVDVQAFNPAGHATGADLRAQRFQSVALGQVGVVGSPVRARELRVGGQPIRHLPHRATGLDAAHQPGQPPAGQVVERGERGAIGQPRRSLHHAGQAARAAVRNRPQRPGRAT